jgi:hypothetical protein
MQAKVRHSADRGGGSWGRLGSSLVIEQVYEIGGDAAPRDLPRGASRNLDTSDRVLHAGFTAIDLPLMHVP